MQKSKIQLKSKIIELLDPETESLPQCVINSE